MMFIVGLGDQSLALGLGAASPIKIQHPSLLHAPHILVFGKAAVNWGTIFERKLGPSTMFDMLVPKGSKTKREVVLPAGHLCGLPSPLLAHLAAILA